MNDLCTWVRQLMMEDIYTRVWQLLMEIFVLELDNSNWKIWNELDKS